MTFIYAVSIWLCAWCADQSFRERRYVWAVACAAMSAFSFFMWARAIL
ncbi:hypothetical protein [Brevundimonas sp.]